MEFEDYELGILSMDFSEEIEIVETYLPESQLTGLEQAVNLVVMEQETPSVYEVVAGDTLSEIAIKVNIPMDAIVAMNDSLEDENTMLQIGQELLITVPEPELSVTRVEEEYYEETYDADIQYVENDSWYTNQMVVHQQPSAGFRKVVADVPGSIPSTFGGSSFCASHGCCHPFAYWHYSICGTGMQYAPGVIYCILLYKKVSYIFIKTP